MGFELDIPPLRERPKDLVALAAAFLKAADGAGSARGFTRAALDKLTRHRFPGNVRELAFTVRRAVALNPVGDIGAEAIQFTAAPTGESAGPLSEAQVRAVLESHRGNRSRAADELGISLQTLYRLLEKYGLSGVKG
jgi:DNA-binding NtrC family response regulator